MPGAGLGQRALRARRLLRRPVAVPLREDPLGPVGDVDVDHRAGRVAGAGQRHGERARSAPVRPGSHDAL